MSTIDTRNSAPDATQPGEVPNAPYCGNCGYDLIGATESSKCPECGLPLIEVLLRRGAPVLRGVRYRSDATVFGLPLLAVAFGPGIEGPRGHAKGFIAIGDVATGVVAFGGFARGGVCVGGFSFGVVSLGGMTIGLLTSMGGVAIGGVAIGGGAVGGVAIGGGAVGVIASGGAAVGWAAQGGGAWGAHTITFRGPSDATATQVFTTLHPFIGTIGSMARPAGWIASFDLAAIAVLLVAAWTFAGRGAFGAALAGLRTARLPMPGQRA